MLLLATTTGLHDLDRGVDLLDGAVTALAVGPGGVPVALVERARVVAVTPDGPSTVATLPQPTGQSLAVRPDGTVVVGVRGAHVWSHGSTGWVQHTTFDDVPGRADWENPAGPEPDARTLAVGRAGRVWLGVHVGGLWGSDDLVRWDGAVEPDADVHQVVADDDGRVAVAAAVGFGWSDDDGATWSWTTDGLPASYALAVAIDGDHVLLGASSGPFARQGGLYRARWGGPFQRVGGGLPAWFPGSVPSGALALRGDRAAVAGPDGTVFVSSDGGATWELAASDRGRVTALALV